MWQVSLTDDTRVIIYDHMFIVQATSDLKMDQVYCILSSIVCTFYIENDAEIFPVHYTWKVAEKEFKIAFTMNKLAIINSFEIILEK
jgi:hypothetical protein